MKLSEMISVLEVIAPPEYAMANDRIGLQVGDPDQDINKIVVTVDATPSVISEAARRSAQLIIAHHPVIYSPLPSVRLDLYPQSLIYTIVKSGIALYVMHTNFDCADGGINDALAERLGIEGTKVMSPVYTEKLFKLVTFVPNEALEEVREALADAGAGVIGDYSNCSFQTSGTGTFIPGLGTAPYCGEVGKLERPSEIRLEMLVPKNALSSVVTSLLATHPYEEPAYDIYPLKNEGEQWGLGRIGKLKTRMTFDGFCEMVRDALEVEELRTCGDPDAQVHTVAVLGGAGGGEIPLAHSLGADVYVTGDVRHHELLQAQALGLNVIDATHFHTERPGMIGLAPKLHDLLSSEGVTVEYVE
jgi:dinuclear metal center YbgI/SA1388 family protein